MTPRHQDKTKARQTSLARQLLPWLILALIVFAVGLVVGTMNFGDQPEPVPTVTAPAEATRDVILYFATADGRTLAAESRRINECPTEEDCLRETVEELIAGPQSGLVAILPEQTRLRGVTVTDSLVTLDFSREFASAHPGGTQSELLTVYGLADTLTANFPHLRQVRLLVDGESVETLKGHVDLRQPVYPDFSFVEEGAAPIGKFESLPAGRDE